jgi:hypothetical protein
VKFVTKGSGCDFVQESPYTEFFFKKARYHGYNGNTQKCDLRAVFQDDFVRLGGYSGVRRFVCNLTNNHCRFYGDGSGSFDADTDYFLALT